jgi:hypothetical protein
VGIAVATGPPLGGTLTEQLSWQDLSLEVGRSKDMIIRGGAKMARATRLNYLRYDRR